MTGTGVPVIDIGAFNGDAQARDAVKRAVTDALERVGFMVVTGHGVPVQTIDNLIQSANAFFAQPHETKDRLLVPGQKLNRGYIPSEGEKIGRADELPDLKEAFVMGRSNVDETMRSLPGAATAYPPNIWPDWPPEFRRNLEAYYEALSALTIRMTRIFAYTLDLPADFLVPGFNRHPSVLRIQHYPAQETKPGQMRAAEHRDYGAFTILREGDQTGGLQVKMLSGEWVDIRSTGDSFIINIGNIMQRWSNDRWVSNPHRVVTPPGAAGWQRDRLSIPYFVYPNPDTMIECLPSCQGADNPAHHAPIMCADLRMQQLSQNYVS